MKKSMGKTIITLVIMAVILFAGNRGLAQLQQNNEAAYLDKILPYLLPGSVNFTLEEDYTAETVEIETDSETAEGTADSTEEESSEEAVEVEAQEQIIKRVYRGETGYVIRTVTRGYVDEVELLVGVDDDGMVRGICVYGQQETFGLGSRSRYDVAFLSQYLGTTGEAETGSTVDALTGATVSSKAVTKGVNAAVAYVTGADISSGATTWGG